MGQTIDHDLVIVGAGPAGLTAALYAGRSMLDAVVLERGAPGGELLNTEKIDDYPGFESILGAELAQKMEEHAVKFGAKIVQANVRAIRKSAGAFSIETDEGDVFNARAVILTAGGTPVKLNVPGELEYAGKGVSYCAICDGAFFRDHVLAVVGGGDAAVEEADFLTRYAKKVYVVHRRGEFRASKILQERLFANPKIEVVWNSVVEEISGDEHGLVKGLQLRNVETDEKSELPVTGVFIFVGFQPNTGIVQCHAKHDALGYMYTDQNMETSIKGLFAAGDVRVQLTRQITTAAGDATTAAIAAEKYLSALKQEVTA